MFIQITRVENIWEVNSAVLYLRNAPNLYTKLHCSGPACIVQGPYPQAFWFPGNNPKPSPSSQVCLGMLRGTDAPNDPGGSPSDALRTGFQQRIHLRPCHWRVLHPSSGLNVQIARDLPVRSRVSVFDFVTRWQLRKLSAMTSRHFRRSDRLDSKERRPNHNPTSRWGSCHFENKVYLWNVRVPEYPHYCCWSQSILSVWKTRRFSAGFSKVSYTHSVVKNWLICSWPATLKFLGIWVRSSLPMSTWYWMAFDELMWATDSSEPMNCAFQSGGMTFIIWSISGASTPWGRFSIRSATLVGL